MKRIYCIVSQLIPALMLFFGTTTVIGQDELPAKPLLNFVTVDTSDNSVLLDWKASTSPGILYYKIYSLDISTFPVTGTYIDSVPAGQLQYSHRPPDDELLIYTVTAVDGSGESLLSGDYHKTVRLSTEYDSCAREMHLEWSRYIGWDSYITGYKVYGDDGCECLEQIAIVDTSTRSFTLGNIEENKHYNFVVKAFDNRGNSSLSRIKGYFTYMPAPPSYINLDYVSVLDDQSVEISFSADLSGEINDFRISRGDSPESTFIPWTNILDMQHSPYLLNDQFPTKGVKIYYRIDALNSCDQPVSSSNIAANIILSGEVDGNTATLNWNTYEDFEGGVEEYQVYRMNHYNEYELISTFGPETVSFVDELSEAARNHVKGEMLYQVEAIETNQNPYGVRGRSLSNEITLDLETDIYMPNAFTPNNDGMNDLFRPVFNFIPESYKMMIYDRSGKQLFFTTDPFDGWDGTLNGSTMARQGVYIYHVEYASYSGTRKELTGNLSLVNP